MSALTVLLSPLFCPLEYLVKKQIRRRRKGGMRDELGKHRAKI